MQTNARVQAVPHLPAQHRDALPGQERHSTGWIQKAVSGGRVLGSYLRPSQRTNVKYSCRILWDKAMSYGLHGEGRRKGTARSLMESYFLGTVPEDLRYSRQLGIQQSQLSDR